MSGPDLAAINMRSEVAPLAPLLRGLGFELGSVRADLLDRPAADDRRYLVLNFSTEARRTTAAHVIMMAAAAFGGLELVHAMGDAKGVTIGRHHFLFWEGGFGWPPDFKGPSQ
jgi:hypothetical protein